MVNSRTGRRAARVCASGSLTCVVVLIVFALGAVSWAQSAATLTNDDVVKMVRAQLGTSIIRTTIDASNATFDVARARRYQVRTCT